MKQAFKTAIVSGVVTAFAFTTAFGGTGSLYDSKDIKEVKQVVPPAPAPTPCDWTGFYVGLHSGGQFGDSDTHDFATGRVFGYDESGFNGGMQFGYNYQWKWLVFGPEFDIGYMNLTGKGDEPHFTGVHGETDSDFYATMRGRVGVKLDCHGCWLIYATGGAITVNYTTRYHIDPNFFDSRGNDFNWGYTVGGGIEKSLAPHWSIKTEYLYYSLDEQSFGEPINGVPVNFRAESRGHILRVGLNYKF